jgi:hypothetical protein
MNTLTSRILGSCLLCAVLSPLQPAHAQQVLPADLPSQRTCATPEPSSAEVLRSSNESRSFNIRSSYLRVERVKFLVPIAFHVIHAGGVGNVTDQQIDAQINVLNVKLGPLGYIFKKRSITRTDNASWQRMIDGEQVELDAKTTLSVDPGQALNFYILIPRYRDARSQAVTTALGIASFPWWMGEDTHNPQLDGVSVHYATLPGSASGAFDLGQTAVHEVGHWIGLLHTFHGGGAFTQDSTDGCQPPGDEVSDTPYERRPHFGPGVGSACPTATISECSAGSFNPISNYMNYADDRCMNEWTTGQDLRARNIMQRFRDGFVARSPDVVLFNEMRRRLKGL